jgi:hypothetical protein
MKIKFKFTIEIEEKSREYLLVSPLRLATTRMFR